MIELELCKRTEPRYSEFRDRHYIPNNGCHGQQLHYLVHVDGFHVGIISGASSVYAVKSRDEFFGLSSEKKIKQAQLSSLINNVVYRLECPVPNLASEVLAKWRRRIAKDWEFLYQVRVAGFETFVIEEGLKDGRTRNGCLYKADNWAYLGETAGNTKHHSTGLTQQHTRKTVCKKLIFARKVKKVKLSESYQSSWKDPEASKALAKRRKELFK